jgi:hypothetical protein
MLFNEPMANIPGIVWDGMVAGWMDLDFINSLPLMGAALVAAGCLRPEVRKAVMDLLRIPIVGITLICTLLLLSANALLVGYETPCRFSVLRYMPHAIMGLSLIPPLLIGRLSNCVATATHRRLFLSACFLAFVFTNLGTLSYWIATMPCRDARFSWWAPVLSEIAAPPDDPVDRVIRSLPEPPEGGANRTLAVWPSYQNEIFIFYCGAAFLVIPQVSPGTECEKAVLAHIGQERYQAFAKPPDRIILFQHRLKTAPAGYDSAVYPFFRKTPDATRPELTRRSFAAPVQAAENFIAVYSRNLYE